MPVQFARKRVKYRWYEDRIELLEDDKVADTVQLAAGKAKNIIGLPLPGSQPSEKGAASAAGEVRRAGSVGLSISSGA